MADIAGVAVGSGISLRYNDLGRRIATLFSGVLQAARARAHISRPARCPERRYHHPRRESYLEEAAMSRAMDRL